MTGCYRAVLLAVLGLLAGPATAGYGVFAHGFGIRSEGAGGIAVAHAEDTAAMAANSAAAATLGRRFDAGIDAMYVKAGSEVLGNALAPDARYDSDGQQYFFIPQAGYVQPLGERSALGVTVFNAGFGTDYPQSPYTRFGGDPRAGIKLAQTVVSTSLAFTPFEAQHFGIGFNLAYQEVKVTGLDFLAPLSQSPGHVSDQGADSTFGYSLQLGWQGRITERLGGGLAWRSKTHLGRFQRYEGLLPDGGELDLPSSYAAGLFYRPLPTLGLGVDFSRIHYSDEAATGNPASRLAQGMPFGADDGPGFGFNDQKLWKFGAIWQVNPVWTLRAGYSRSNRLMPTAETFFGMAAPVVMREHYTLGATRALAGGWEWSAFAALARRHRVNGSDSIPAAFGGGEANVEVEQQMLGLGVSRRF